MFAFKPSHLFHRPHSATWSYAVACRPALMLLAVFWLGCSSGGTSTATATCSPTQPCPDNLVCVVDKGLCALPNPGGSDLGIGAGDLAGSGSSDLAGTTPDLANRADDLGEPADLAMMALDMRMPTDLAMPADMAMPPPSGKGVCPSAHFCWENPLPQPTQLSAMWGTGPNDLWAVGWSGVAIHWDGTSFTQVPTGTTMFLTAVWGRSSSEMWVLTGDGAILFWDGTRFTTQRSATGMGLDGIWGDSSTVWAVGSGGLILKWNGTSWVSVPSGMAGSLYGIWGSAGNDIWAVSDDQACHFGGSSWTCASTFATGGATTITGTARNDVWALGARGKAWHWNGAAWTESTIPSPSEYPSSAYAVDAKNLWAVGSNGFAWHYDGTSWTSAQIDTANALLGVFATSASNVYAVGGSGDILHYDTSWQARKSGFSANVTAMWGVSDHDLWVFTDDKNARHYDGTNWTITALPGIAYSATGTSATDLWVGSDNGRLFHYAGASWTTVTTADSTARINGIYLAASDRVVLAGSPTVQFWDGARYTVSLTPTSGALSAWGTGPSDIWVGVSDSCAAYHHDGASWTRYQIGGGGCSGVVLGIHGTSSKDAYFISDGLSQPSHWDGTRFTAVTGFSAIGTAAAVYATPTRVFVATTDGEVYTGLGAVWSKAVQVDYQLTSILGWSADKAWVGGGGGFLLSYKP